MDALFYVWEFSHQIEDFVPIAAFVDLASAERLRSARWAAGACVGILQETEDEANARIAEIGTAVPSPERPATPEEEDQIAEQFARLGAEIVVEGGVASSRAAEPAPASKLN